MKRIYGDIFGDFVIHGNGVITVSHMGLWCIAKQEVGKVLHHYPHRGHSDDVNIFHKYLTQIYGVSPTADKYGILVMHNVFHYHGNKMVISHINFSDSSRSDVASISRDLCVFTHIPLS